VFALLRLADEIQYALLKARCRIKDRFLDCSASSKNSISGASRMKLTKPNGNYQSRRTSLLAALLIGALLAQNAGAQSSKETMLNASAVALNATMAASDIGVPVAKSPASALLAVDQNRGSIIDTIVNFWQADASASKDASVRATEGAELRATLSSLRADHLLAASNARTLDGLKQIFVFADTATASNKTTSLAKSDLKNGIAPAPLSTPTTDTTYTPIAPCKLVDTRGTAGYNVAGGAFAAAEKRTYDAYSGCGPAIPNMAAIQVSAVTSYGGTGGGILSMMKNGDTPPLTNIFYSGYVPVTTTVPVNGAGSGGLFDVQISGVAGTHVIIEVVGYFAQPAATPLDCVLSPLQILTLPNGYNNYNFTTGVCASGYTPVSPYCWDGQAAGVYSSGSGMNPGAFCAWKNQSGATATVYQGTTCCRIPGR
jgi:hypothetical protein